ncbi:hypothetical protein COOONC_06321 [Cooperia oncophora]
MSNMSFLIVDICILLLQIATFTFNGFILFMFLRAKKLWKNPSFRLMLFLACTDFLHALTTLPYITYLTRNWNPLFIDLDPYYVMISSIPLTIQLKIYLTLTISIAFERTLALFFPMTYRTLPSSKYALCSLLIGCLLAVIDLILEFLLSPFQKSPNCAAIGCFISAKFRYYWGTSNMVMGLFVIVLTTLVIIKLRLIEKKSHSQQIVANKDSKRFGQANRTSAGILLTSLVFVTIPSVCVGFVEMIGYSFFKTVGPFYIVGLLCAGFCNSIVYVVLNRDMRDLVKELHFPYTSHNNGNVFDFHENFFHS